MKLFLDTADVAAIREMVSTGRVDGVMTSPSLIAKSLRHQGHVSAAASAGAEAATLPPDTFPALIKPPLADKGLELFLADWERTGQSILARGE